MFGRPLSTLLGSPKDIEVIYKEFKRLCFLKRKEAFHKLNKKHHAKYSPELQLGQLVRVKAPTDKGNGGIVKSKDNLPPQSYWGTVG